MRLPHQQGQLEDIKKQGLPAFHQALRETAPFLGDRVEELKDWAQVSLLTVTVDRLKKWHVPGLLCIGDAAHAMSPVGGVGINLAIQDAVATANLLTSALLGSEPIAEELLAQVQTRRTFPTRITQRLQVFAQDHMIRRILESDTLVRPSWILKLLKAWPFLQRWPARLIGLGFRPEHFHTVQAPR